MTTTAESPAGPCLRDCTLPELLTELEGRRSAMLTEVACINVSLSTRRAVEIDECLRVASAIWNVDSDDMMSKARSHVVAEARMVVMDHLRSKGMTLQKIGGIFRRDHGTVIHAVRTVADRQASDHEFAARLRAFRIQLTPTKPNNGQPE